ncbi:hypothetical protein HRbin01_01245 [archaeon HR01]|nr:hypothetical protein HRbin01_01245 [archaeon HR01]
MTADIKREIIRLLQEDMEFRYTVAGLIGLEEVLRRLDRHEQRMTELLEEQRNIRNEQAKIWEEIKKLRENQEKLWEEVRELRIGQEKLWENQNRLWEEVKALREGQNKLFEGYGRLEKALEELASVQKNLTRQVGALSDTIGFGIEDIARVIVPGWLLRHEGIKMVDEFVRRWVAVDGEEIEVNLYGEGFRNGEKITIIGEAKSRIYRNEVVGFDRWASLVEKALGGTVYKFMCGYLVHPSAEDEAKKRRITLIASYMR